MSGTAAWRVPSRLAALWFTLRAAGHRALRAGRNLRHPVPRHHRSTRLADAPITAQSRSTLWTDGRPEEWALVAGKVHNLRLACRFFDGLLVPAGTTLSFWRQLGRPSRARGFVEGREVREGCVLPTVAGGLCQISNAGALCRRGWAGGGGTAPPHPAGGFRHQPGRAQAQARTAVLVDEWTPEFAAYLAAHEALPPGCCPGRCAVAALDGWVYPSSTFTARAASLWRAVVTRWHTWGPGPTGGQRQAAVLAMAYARQLRPEHPRVVVEQSLLAPLQALGALGGRQVEVLARELPMAEVQTRLDAAHARWPQAATLVDFRAGTQGLADEAAALQRADHLVTPHAEVAGHRSPPRWQRGSGGVARVCGACAAGCPAGALARPAGGRIDRVRIERPPGHRRGDGR